MTANRVVRRTAVWPSALMLVVAAVALGTGGAAAVGHAAYASWQPLVGVSGDYTGVVRLAPRFPTATYTSDSRAGQVGVQTGASAWLPAWTPVGEVYGSSQNQQYLNLRPRADRAGEPSTTTYTFDRATPLGWTYVLGDIDADAVQVSAVTADGTPATAAELGFRGAFNYCERTPRPSTCGGAQNDRPTWRPATRTLVGNAAARDTTGASGWFEPTVPLRTLTFSYSQRSGFPVYQTWFAVRTHDLTGTLSLAAGSDGTCPRDDIELELRDDTGEVVATTTADTSGAYGFAGLPAGPGYTVAIGNVPMACRVVGPSVSGRIDLTAVDGVADFEVRRLVPVAILGSVTEQGSGQAIEGATVTLSRAGGSAVTTLTGDDGSYVFDDNPAGEYTITVTRPDGYATVSAPRTVTVAPNDESAKTGNDFEVLANPDLSGTITAGGEPVAGVVVVAQPANGGAVLRAVTDDAGDYAFERITNGTYTLTIPQPPAGYRVPATRTAQIAGADSADNDFALTRPGAVGGTVSEDEPVAGALVTVTGPNGFRRTVITGDDGRYFLDGLATGEYTIRLTPPRGTTASTTARTVQITDAGEVLGEEDFRVITPARPRPTPTPGDQQNSSAAGNNSSGASRVGNEPSGPATATGPTPLLPDTGGPSRWWLCAGAVLLLAGALLTARGSHRPQRVRR